MGKKTIVVYVETDKVGSKCETTFEVEDDTTEKDIEDIARNAVWDMAVWGYYVEEED